MPKIPRVFGFELGTHGVSICSIQDFVTDAAMTEAQLDKRVRVAKADLDAAVRRAKMALKKYLSKSPTPKSRNSRDIER